MGDLAKVNAEGRVVANRLGAELIALREAVATHLRYIEGEVIDGLRTGRHDAEVAANIAQHQARNLRFAVEATGPLQPAGTAGTTLRLPSKSGQPISDYKSGEGR